MAEFTKEFNVEKYRPTSDWADYKDFIKDLRLRLQHRLSHNLPVLPPQENPPTRWFDIILRTNNHSIRLRIRRGNLYLDAYQIENSKQWLEFGSSSSTSPHLIPGSTFLGFDGGYPALVNVANQCMNEIDLGQIQLTYAVNQLATSTTSATRSRSLIIVIQMISESIRFTRISEHLATTFRSGSPAPQWMVDLEHGWGDLSAALLRADANPDDFFQLPQPNAMNIVSALDAVAVLGIILRSSRVPTIPLVEV